METKFDIKISAGDQVFESGTRTFQSVDNRNNMIAADWKVVGVARGSVEGSLSVTGCVDDLPHDIVVTYLGVEFNGRLTMKTYGSEHNTWDFYYMLTTV